MTDTSPTPSQNTATVSKTQAKLSRWDKGAHPVATRLKDGVVVPAWKPSFKLKAGAKVFAIGSCFARNIERYLLKTPVQVTSVDLQSPTMEIKTNAQLGLLNKFNPVSIQQELEWAAGHSDFPTEALIENNKKTIDPFLHEQTVPGSREMVLARRAALKDYFARAFEADVIILTFGLTETWFDKETKRALNGPLSPRLLTKNPDRYGVRGLNAAECYAVINSICTLLEKRRTVDQSIVLTVSPVPMARTFSDQDVITANMQSKSTLRSAAGQVAQERRAIDYFPSYEAAMMSDPAVVWRSNRRDVTDEIVAHIVGAFLKTTGFKQS